MNYQNFQVKSELRDRDYSYQTAVPVLIRKVYLWMTLALAITGLTAYVVATTPSLINAIFENSLYWVLIIAELALVFIVSSMIDRLSLSTATMLFVLYSIVNGATLSSIFIVFAAESIASVFFITAGTFGVMAFIGYTTKTDLTKMGKILLMALIGIVIATLVNMFVKSSGLQTIVSYIGVVIFVGLTAYDSQKIKQLLIGAPEENEMAQKIALLGALTLYLDFINLFLYLLRILGKVNRD